MESGNSGASNKGVLVPVSASSDVFQNSILAQLKSAYLYEESKQSFRYESAILIKNPALEKKYSDFRAKRREAGYSEEDLKESYGFLLFDDANKANVLAETGVLTGNSTCTTLGDPSKGVYIPMYSDCLDLNRWYHGKSGYIAIIRLTKGRVNRVIENYTQNFTAPTKGFDCHVSEQLPSVSAKTSSFLAFERTQYYIYELLNDGSNETAQSPSAACPFAIVSFSYTDTKATLLAPLEKSEEKKLVCNYFLWRGQFQIGTHFYGFGLKSTEGVTLPATLPPVVKVDHAISMSDLRQLLPRTVFETCFSSEVFLEGLYCSLCELVSSEVEQTRSLSLLLQEIKEKDVALIVPLNDGGFLILLHSSHFLTYDDSGSCADEVLQGMFVFPDSRVIQRETKFGQKKHAMSSEVLRVLPVLSYAEGEVEKSSIEPSEELCEVLAQHMQSYAVLINPGLASSPSRDLSIFPDQYDVPDAHKHLYLAPEWTNRAWQNFRSYLNKPVSFQLPVSKASEIMAAGQEERIEDLDDDVYFCPSSPEEALASHASMESEDQLTGKKSALNVETFEDSCTTSADAQTDSTAVPHSVVPDDLQSENATEDTGKSDLAVLVKADNMGTKDLLTPSTSDDLPAELIVSITSAEQTVSDASLSVISTESTIKHNDFQLAGFSTAKFETIGMNSLNDEPAIAKKVVDCSELPSLSKTKRRKLRRRRFKGRKRVSKARLEAPSLETVKIPVEDDTLKSQKEYQAKKLPSDPQLSNPSERGWRKLRGRELQGGSPKNKKVRSATVGFAVAEDQNQIAGHQSFESTILKELEACPLRKKAERWDLKPVISECGRILVPHGSVDIADQIKTLKDKFQSTKEQSHEKMSVDSSMNACVTDEMEQKSSDAPETAADETEATTSKTEGNHFQNVVSHVDPEHNILQQTDDHSGSITMDSERSKQSLKSDGMDTPLKTVQEKGTDASFLGKCTTKGEILLSKLKSVLSRKRIISKPVSGEKTAETAQDTEPCPKKGKVDSDSVMLTTDDKPTIVQDASLGVKEVSKMPSVDLLFAYALGLTPRETADKIQKSEDQDTQQRTDSAELQQQTILDEQHQIIQRPLPIIPKRGRIKTLKKHQGISEEYVKKKWWLHFQTPACFASEKLKSKECTSDNAVRKTVKEKSSGACSSTDALNLLADLALSANNEQVPLQPDPAKRKPETSLKKCDLTKDVASGEPESVLHALLRQPAARPLQSLESPKPNHLVGGSEMVSVISREHAYSLPPSSSLLLGLSGTPFQVSPLSGSTRLLHHHQTMCGDAVKTLHPSVDQEDINEHSHRTPEYLKKYMVRRRKFRHSRTFVNKNGSVQVTKQWKGNYDFNLDSKYTNDSKDKTIIRALHGPWDFSVQDTSEEMRLIVHMWIGLFYSRSTARFFHFDSNLEEAISDESDILELSREMVSAQAQSELKASSVAPYPNVSDTSDSVISNALDLSKKDYTVLDQGSVILDLSLRNSMAENVTSHPQIIRKETSVSGEQKEASESLNTSKSSKGPRKCYRSSVHSTEITNEVNDVRSTNESERTPTSLHKAGSLECTNLPSTESGGTFTSVQGDTERVPSQLESYQTALGTGHMLHGSYNKKTDMKDSFVNTEAIKMSLVRKRERDSSKSVADKEEDISKKSGDVIHRVEHNETESKDGQNWEVKENPCQEGKQELSPYMICASDDSTNIESGVVFNRHILEDEKQLPLEEPEAISPGKAANDNKDEDCCVIHKDNVTKSDSFRKDVVDEKDRCSSGVEADRNLNHQLPMMSDGPDSVKKDYTPEYNDQNDEAPLDEQDICQNLQLRELCANGSALTDDHTISEIAPYDPPEMKPVQNKPADDENFKNDICPAVLNDQLFASDSPDSVKKDFIPESNVKAPLDEQLPQADYKEDACHDLQSRELCVNVSTPSNDHAISEIAPHDPPEIEPAQNKPAEDEIFKNDICPSVLNDQPLPTSDSPDSIKKDFIPQCNGKAPLDEQLPQADYKEDACHDLQSRELFANVSTPSNDHAISEKAPHDPPEIEPAQNKPAEDEIFKNDIGPAVLNDQPLPTSDSPDSVKKDFIPESNGKAPPDEQLPQADYKEDPCHDLQSRELCSNVSAPSNDHAISEIAPHDPPEIEPVQNKPAEDEIFKNDICPAVLNDQLFASDSPDSIKKDFIPQCNVKAPLDDWLPQADYKEDACHDLQSRELCANVSTATNDHTISETAPHDPSQMEPVQNAPADEGNSEDCICSSVLNDQPLSTCDGPDSVKKDCITLSSLQAQLDEQSTQAECKEHVFQDLQLCTTSGPLMDEHTISEKAPHTSSEIESIHNEPVVEENSKNYICLANKAHNQDAALPMSDKSTCLIDGSSSDGSTPQISYNVETGSQSKIMANFSPSSNDQENQETMSIKEKHNVDNIAQEQELCNYQSHSPKFVAVTGFEAKVSMTKTTALKNFKSNEGFENLHTRVVIPFIGLDISGEDVSHSEGEAEEVRSHKGTSFINETTNPKTVLPTEICSTSQMGNKRGEHTTDKVSLSLADKSKRSQSVVSGSESDDRCPTPTIDEEPCQYVTLSGSFGSSSSALSGSEALKSIPHKILSRGLTLREDEMLPVSKHRTTVHSESHPHHGLHPDLELRTLRVLQSIGDYFYSSRDTDKSSQIKTADFKRSVDEPDKLQETSLGQECHSRRSFTSIEYLQAIKQNIGKDRHKTAAEANLCHEPRLHSQRPVMAVKPSKSDEIQADYIPKGRETKNSVMSNYSKNQQNEALTASKLSSKSSWLSNVSDSKSCSDLAKYPHLDPLHQCKGSGISVVNKFALSSLPMQSFESAKASCKPVDGSQDFSTNSSVEKVGQTFKESTEKNPKDCSDASTSVDYYRDDSIIDDSFCLPPQSSLTCTVYNTSRKRSASFLEQLSQRCLQDDLTQASMEQECLIFSEQMKQLLKRTKTGPIHQLDAYDSLNLSSSGPVTVCFSSLEEQEDSAYNTDAPSVVGLKIRVDMSDRKDQTGNPEEENNLHPKKSSQGAENPMEHAGVSSVTAECARLYTATMNDVCAVKRIPSRPGQFRIDRGYSKTEPSSHFDFCDQMKKEVDESFRSNLNSVVKKCCKTKYRFYILVTSDDAFFKETQAHLVTEGHTAVQPSEFFLCEDRSSSLLIILRNEDIAEHICEVPHLLELKMSPDVQFAGIDELDDVVNLTHQELFIRGGFIMFDRAALSSLSLCNMKQISEILLELSGMGKWKWMVHYRDSRRVKENARLSAEAKEKKNFLNWCQEAGILEVLPYHECDLTSRDQPDYLTCLVHLQVQNISARYTVFITDTRTDSAFGTNGILTMTLKSFLSCSPSETFKA